MDAPARPARCSRGRLLRQHSEECWRATQYVGTRGMSGAGDMILQESRGRIVRHLCETWGAQRVLSHMQKVFSVLRVVERKVVMG